MADLAQVDAYRVVYRHAFGRKHAVNDALKLFWALFNYLFDFGGGYCEGISVRLALVKLLLVGRGLDSLYLEHLYYIDDRRVTILPARTSARTFLDRDHLDFSDIT